MTCCVCRSESNPTIRISLARKLPFEHDTQDVRFCEDRIIEPMRHRVYTVCVGACEATIEHTAGWHENVPDSKCAECVDALALMEIQALSPEAKGLILHRLRNPLAIVSGNLDLLFDFTKPLQLALRNTSMAVGDHFGRYIDPARDACDRLNIEISEMFS